MNTRMAFSLWYDTRALCSVFPYSRLISRNIIYDTPSGDCDYLSLELWGQKFKIDKLLQACL